MTMDDLPKNPHGEYSVTINGNGPRLIMHEMIVPLSRDEIERQIKFWQKFLDATKRVKL